MIFEYVQDSWTVKPSFGHRPINFEQALIRAESSSGGKIHGSLLSIHGVSPQDMQQLRDRVSGAGFQSMLGRLGALNAGSRETRKPCMRLMPNGDIEVP